MHRPVLTNLILQEATVRLLDILWQVGIEHERWYLRVGQLRAVFYLYELTLCRWWRCLLYDRQHHLVELVGAHMCRAVLVDIHCRLKHLEDALLRQCGGEDDGEVGKRRS